MSLNVMIAAACSFVVCLTANSTLWWLISAFIGRVPMRLSHVVTLSLLVSAAFAVFGRFRPDARISARVLVGAVSGFLAGAPALSFSNMALPNGLRRLVSSPKVDVLPSILVDAVVSSALGSWLVGAFAFVISGWMLRGCQQGNGFQAERLHRQFR